MCWGRLLSAVLRFWRLKLNSSGRERLLLTCLYEVFILSSVEGKWVFWPLVHISHEPALHGEGSPHYKHTARFPEVLDPRLQEPCLAPYLNKGLLSGGGVGTWALGAFVLKWGALEWCDCCRAEIRAQLIVFLKIKAFELLGQSIARLWSSTPPLSPCVYLSCSLLLKAHLYRKGLFVNG